MDGYRNNLEGRPGGASKEAENWECFARGSRFCGVGDWWSAVNEVGYVHDGRNYCCNEVDCRELLDWTEYIQGRRNHLCRRREEGEVSH